MKTEHTNIVGKKRRCRQQGFTLLETGVAILLMSLILLGTMSLYTAVTRTTTSTSARLYASQDAANALQRIIEEAREARWVALPGENDAKGQPMFSVRPDYASSAYYATTYDSQTIQTAVMLTFPKDAANLTIKTGSSSYSLSGSSKLYERSGDGDKFLIYRSDAAGVPDPGAGKCLWFYSLSDNGKKMNRALITSVAEAANAVQFVRPVDNQGNALPYQLEIKIVSAYYSPIKGVKTSEAGDGRYVTALTGKCVQMRNHERAREHNPLTSPASSPTNSWLPN